MADSYDELSKRATFKGDREAQTELFELGEKLEREENYAQACSVYREAAIAYRLAAFRGRTRAEEAEAHAEWKSGVEEIYRRWVESNPNGACKLPRRESSVDKDGIRKIVVDQLLYEREFEILFTYLETTLSALGLEFYSPGGSIQRRVFQLLFVVFGLEQQSEALANYLGHTSVRVGLDPIADEVVKRCSEKWPKQSSSSKFDNGTMVTNSQEPLERLTYDTQRLMVEHPPVLRNPNKRIVFQIACPEGCLHEGHLEYSRWSPMSLPGEIEAKAAWDQVLSREDVYDYAPVRGNAKGVEWHVNFSDPYLFTAYSSSLLAQDEMQVCEHPALGALKQALDAGGHQALTVEQGTPTPILVMGVERRCSVSTDPNEAEGRPGGLYGNAFARAETDVIRRAVHKIEPPTTSNIIAMAAPSGGYGQYDRVTIEYILVTAYSGFRAAVLESRRVLGQSCEVAVHTGFWGCGAFGGHRVLMALIQVMAAEMAELDCLIMHTFDVDGTRALCEARKSLGTVRSKSGVIASDELIDRITALGFEWGVSDGN